MTQNKLNKKERQMYLNAISEDIYSGKPFKDLNYHQKKIIYFSVISRRKAEELTDSIVEQLRKEIYNKEMI